ncbi:MAG: GNAT family N-acetyltransferase [Sulfolobales archaeon]|nr:GNAT family N-acetyltransferase [Sulfolobales archaeon]MDW8082249.1 GNAT family N-acetyltransferase [Sulfolobales archaeon]
MLNTSSNTSRPFSEIRERLRELTGGDYREFLHVFKKSIRSARVLNQRRIVALCGRDSIKLAGLAVELVARYLKTAARSSSREGTTKILYFYHDEFPEARDRVVIARKALKHLTKSLNISRVELEFAVYEKSAKYLGTTVQVLVLDLLNDLRPNDVGRLIGIVEGGGIIVLLTPPHESWPKQMTLFKQSLTVPNHPEPRHIFISWFLHHLYSHSGILIYDTDSSKLLKKDSNAESLTVGSCEKKELRIPQEKLFPEELYRLALTQDQVDVIEAVERNMVEIFRDFKHQVLVVVADRGRGKSSAVGIAIVGLIKELLKYKNRVRIAVTANEPSSIQSLMFLAMRALDVLEEKYRAIKRESLLIEIKSDRFSIEYWSPLDILKLGVDVVVVDEAAGIPVPLLHKMWKKFRRTIFSTTIHGYEGAGRGFSIRFLKRIKEDGKTRLTIVEMNEPIRYSQDDPIEKFQFNVLLLNAEPVELTSEDFESIKRGDYTYIAYSPEELFSPEGEGVLRQLFGIYVLAHYRNEPDDLGMIADAPHHAVRAIVLKNGKVVAAAQLAEEGGLADEHIEELLKGGKIAGNIIPDRLLKHLRKKVFGRGMGWRVVRIAVHIDAQGIGVGSEFIKRIVDEARSRGYDWVGAGFGITRELLSYWLKNGFKVVHLSPERNPVSGEYTALVIYPLTDVWIKEVEDSLEDFIIKFVESLPAIYRDFETDAAYLILSSLEKPLRVSETVRLRDTQLEKLSLYSTAVFTLEVIFDAAVVVVKKLVFEGKLRYLGQKSGQILIARVLQGKSWEVVSEEFGVSRVSAANSVRSALVRALDILHGAS